MLVLCDTRLVVENYGGGHRWHCPACDTYQGERLPWISWTNSTPPSGERCKRKRVVFPCYTYSLGRFLQSIRYSVGCPALVSPERWAAMHKWVKARARFGEPLVYERF